jgi:hypothetical protein
MNPYSINPPTSDETFEELCLAILKRHWAREGLERFGKKGERQFGVDILDVLGESPLHAAQCKLKEVWKTLEPAEIRTEVDKAKLFPSKLDHYAILTSAKVSTAAQLAVQAINQEHRAAGLFTVEVFHWNRITDLIRQYPEVEQQIFGGMRAEEVAEVKSTLDHIVSLTESVAAQSETSQIDAMIDDARTRINLKEAQVAILLLNRVKQTKGGELSDWHRYRIFTNLGAAHLMIGKGTEAARFFLDAKPLRPDDELAVANEVLAYHLLLQDKDAREKAEAAVAQFPNSTRLRSLWLQAQPLERPYYELLNATPPHLRNDAEVAAALSRRAMSGGRFTEGIRHADDAIAAKPDWGQARLSLAQAHFARLVVADRSVQPLVATDREAALSKVLAVANDAIVASENEGTPYIKAAALALQADIAIMQGRKDDAARLARDAFGADPAEMSGRIAMAQASFTKNDFDEGINILEEAYAKSDFAPNVSYMLGQALMSRGKDGDVDRAFDVFSSAKLVGLSRELIDPHVIGATRALVRSKRFSEIPAYIARPEAAVSPVLIATINAYAALKQESAEAGKLLDEAIRERQETDSAIVTDFLARTLMEAGRLTEALPLLQELFNAQTPNFDVGLLLSCAFRLRQRKVILDTCQTLYDRGARDWDLLEFESQYLEEDDFPKAIARLEGFIVANPEHRIAKVRLGIIATRYGRSDIGLLSEQVLPAPEELPMRYALPVVHVLQWQGQGMLAIEYAYKVLRAHYSELEAHKAYLASVIPGSRPNDLPPATMETVEVGSAIQYTESNAAAAEWVVIEDTNEPKEAFDELEATSDRAKELLGKRVGDTFVVAKSSVKDRVGSILQIISKYARRFQVIGEEMQKKFGEQSVIQLMRIPPAEQLSLTDLQPMLDSAKAQSEAMLQLRELYKSTPATLHMYGDKFGNGVYEAVLDLAISETDFIKCAPPEQEVLASALATLGAKSTVVIELSALATLRLLGITRQVLTSGAFRFVLSPATYAELQQLRAQSRTSTARGTLHYENGQPSYALTSEEQAEREKASFEEWMQCIEENTSVVVVPEITALPPEQREISENVIGRSGLESALLAKAPGHVLWTDDGILAEVVKNELGVERVWTQAMVEHIANLGLMDRSASNEAYAKLVGFNYVCTHFDGQTMLAAVRISNGAVDRFPTHQMIRVFGELYAANKNSAFRLLAEFILRLYSEPFLPETRCLVLKAFLDTFPSEPRTGRLLQSFRQQCVQLLSLNPLTADDFNRCFEQWSRDRRTISLL